MERGICDKIHNSIGIFDDFCCGLVSRDDVIETIKGIGWNWLLAISYTDEMSKRIKQDNNLSDDDWQEFAELFDGGYKSAVKKWEESFGEENNENVSRFIDVSH